MITNENRQQIRQYIQTRDLIFRRYTPFRSVRQGVRLERPRGHATTSCDANGFHCRSSNVLIIAFGSSNRNRFEYRPSDQRCSVLSIA